jgi:adenylylsulfate kinase
MSKNIVWQNSLVSNEQRIGLTKQESPILWFTGISGSGKSTLAYGLEKRLFDLGIRSYVLDGDNLRHGLCKDLGFTEEDRHENIRRVGEVAKILSDSGTLAIASFISPFKKDRDEVRSLVPAGYFIEIFCDSDISICEARDVKGLYKKVREGKIPNFTGIASTYEAPVNPELRIDTHYETIEDCVNIILSYLLILDN